MSPREQVEAFLHFSQGTNLWFWYSKHHIQQNVTSTIDICTLAYMCLIVSHSFVPEGYSHFAICSGCQPFRCKCNHIQPTGELVSKAKMSWKKDKMMNGPRWKLRAKKWLNLIAASQLTGIHGSNITQVIISFSEHYWATVLCRNSWA